MTLRIIGVLGFLAAASIKNRLRSQLRRLKQPRYLVATIFALGYLWFLFGRRLGIETTEFGPDARALVIAGASVFWIPLLLSLWIFGRKRVALSFSEAEIQLLFPAPVSRRALLLYKVCRSLLLVLFSALLTSVLFGARMSGSFVFFLVGAWSGLGLHSLHEMAAQLTRGKLLAQGRRGKIALAAGVTAVQGALVGAFVWFLPPLPTALRSDVLVAWVQQALSGPTGTLLVVTRAPLEVALAPDLAHFVRWLPFVLVLIAAHVGWILRTDAAFEEASVEEAERRARVRDVNRGAAGPKADAPKRSARLRVTGRPELALAWKNLLAARRLWGTRLWGLALPVAAFVVVFALLIGSSVRDGGLAVGLAIALAGASGMVSIIGPGALRSDLRADHAHMDLLRAMPLSGAQVVAGELAGAWMLLVLVQWGLLVAAAVAAVTAVVTTTTFSVELLPVLAGAGAALVLPCVTLMQLLVQNAVVLLLPGWADTGVDRSRGLEAFGQRLLLFAGSLFVLVVVFLPAAALAGGAGAIAWWVIGPWALLVGAGVGTVVLLAEAALGIWLLGRAFERYDLTST